MNNSIKIILLILVVSILLGCSCSCSNKETFVRGRKKGAGKKAGRGAGGIAGIGAGKKPGRGAGKKPGRGAGRKPGRGAGKKPGRGAGKKPGRGAGRIAGRGANIRGPGGIGKGPIFKSAPQGAKNCKGQMISLEPRGIQQGSCESTCDYEYAIDSLDCLGAKPRCCLKNKSLVKKDKASEVSAYSEDNNFASDTRPSWMLSQDQLDAYKKTCDTHSCTGIYKNKPNKNNIECISGTCSDKICCDKDFKNKPTCSNYSCPLGSKIKSNKNNISCAGYPSEENNLCVDTECCDFQKCDTYKCNQYPNYKDKPNKNNIKCTEGTCTVNVCCDKKGAAGKCSDYKCGDKFKKDSFKDGVICADETCTDQECCTRKTCQDSYLSPPMLNSGYKETDFLCGYKADEREQLKLWKDGMVGIECEGAKCTKEECCKSR